MINVKSLFAVLLLVLCLSCSGAKEFHTSEFDIWIGCQTNITPTGNMDVVTHMGGNLQLFNLLLHAVYTMGEKMGILPPIYDDNSLMLLQKCSHEK